MLTVHLRINDAATKQPTPVRLRVTGPQGEYFAPLGRAPDFPTQRGEEVGGNVRLNRERFAYIDGACEIRLPAGVPIRIRATKGPEYRPVDETLTLGAGQMAIRQTITRQYDLDGWVSADSRVQHITPHAAALEAAAEGLQFVNLLASVQTLLSKDANTYVTTPNLTAFSGQVPALSAHGSHVVVNTLNWHPVLGRLALLNSHRTVFPLVFGDPFDSDDWSLVDWCQQCHRKGGLAVWVDAFRPGTGFLGGEALLAAMLGKIDCIELDAIPRDTARLPWVYRLWNAGVKLNLIGGSAKDSNALAMGSMRTYAKGASYSEWIESVRNGVSFVTNGPLVVIDGTTASAMSWQTFEKLDIIADGNVIASTSPTLVDGRYTASVEFDAREHGWSAARVIGGAPLVFAHTAPVWGTPKPPAKESIAAFTRQIEQVREWASERGQYTDEKWRRQLLDHADQCQRMLTGT
jgi:hypothetical protein